MALTHTPPAELGTLCPEFKLPHTQGGEVTRESMGFEKAPFLVAFICNHCPYVKAIENRLLALSGALKVAGVGMLAISSNDAQRYPEDSFEAMQAKGYPFLYAFDESQTVAKSFGAVCTPDFFLYDASGRLAYRGRLDDNWKEPHLVTRQELLEAALLLKQGQAVRGEQTPSMGCSIKWKS